MGENIFEYLAGYKWNSLPEGSTYLSRQGPPQIIHVFEYHQNIRGGGGSNQV